MMNLPGFNTTGWREIPDEAKSFLVDGIGSLPTVSVASVNHLVKELELPYTLFYESAPKAAPKTTLVTPLSTMPFSAPTIVSSSKLSAIGGISVPFCTHTVTSSSDVVSEAVRYSKLVRNAQHFIIESEWKKLPNATKATLMSEINKDSVFTNTLPEDWEWAVRFRLDKHDCSSALNTDNSRMARLDPFNHNASKFLERIGEATLSAAK